MHLVLKFNSFQICKRTIIVPNDFWQNEHLKLFIEQKTVSKSSNVYCPNQPAKTKKDTARRLPEWSPTSVLSPPYEVLLPSAEWDRVLASWYGRIHQSHFHQFRSSFLPLFSPPLASSARAFLGI